MRGGSGSRPERGPWTGAVYLDERLRVAVVRGLALYQRHLRLSRQHVPPGLSDLIAMLDDPSRPEAPLVDAAGVALEPELVNYETAGRLLGGISVRTVERLVEEGRLEKVSVGRRVFVRLADVRELGARRVG